MRPTRHFDPTPCPLSATTGPIGAGSPLRRPSTHCPLGVYVFAPHAPVPTARSTARGRACATAPESVCPDAAIGGRMPRHRPCRRSPLQGRRELKLPPSGTAQGRVLNNETAAL